jgi:hypothetical protein
LLTKRKKEAKKEKAYIITTIFDKNPVLTTDTIIVISRVGAAVC